jgi:hypothetical protein
LLGLTWGGGGNGLHKREDGSKFDDLKEDFHNPQMGDQRSARVVSGGEGVFLRRYSRV